MRYKKFIIKNYRAIPGPIEISVGKCPLMPIIGVNESGKTTILHAIFAFDHYNDDSNEGGRHLNDVSNLYQSASPPATVEAEVETTPAELKKIFAECANENPDAKTVYEELARRRRLPTKLTIRRTITTRNYSIPTEYFGDDHVQDVLSRAMITKLPYILYFDDFRDKIPEEIEIPQQKNDATTEWFDILEQLFRQTDKSFSLYDLPTLEIRQRKTVLSKVQRHLNGTLTKEWQTFRLDDRDALKIHIEFEQKNILSQARPPNSPPTATTKNYVKLEVVEVDQTGDEHFFFISDRSKGFYWFFNFVMKLEFNPKVNATSSNSIYLLDEPGSYLHAYAQRKLCSKLRQIADKNNVFYCTHSHYLLDPRTIPIKFVMVADKDGNGRVTLTRLIDYRGNGSDSHSALQPLLDALEIKPYALDLIHQETTLIVEGMYDYFCLELFRGDRPLCVLPCMGADSIKFYIPLMIAWQVNFRALWDNDAEGRKRHLEAAELFGQDVAQKFLKLLPSASATGRCIMQDLFEGADLCNLRRELDLANDCSFERTVMSLFYSTSKDKLVEGINRTTKDRFAELFASLDL